MISFRRRRLPTVEVIRLEPGDILAVTCPHDITQQQADKVQAAFARKVPGHEVLVVSDNLSLAVLRPEQGW